MPWIPPGSMLTNFLFDSVEVYVVSFHFDWLVFGGEFGGDCSVVSSVVSVGICCLLFGVGFSLHRLSGSNLSHECDLFD